VIHYGAVGLGSVATTMSSTGLATSLTGMGIIVGAPLAVLWLLCAALVLRVCQQPAKNLDAKDVNHEKIFTIAVTKRDSIKELVRKLFMTTRSRIRSSK